MKTFIFLCLIVLAFSSDACSGYPVPFCRVHFTRPNDLVVKGKITAMGSQSLQLTVHEVLSGSETRQVLTIWDGKDFDCNGNVPMNVSGMGNVGDTILAIIPIIKSIQNSWDVIGDYSRPHYLFSFPVLKIVKDTLRGLINNPTSNSSSGTWVDKMKYTEFKTFWSQNQGDCSMLMGIQELGGSKAPMIFQDGFNVHIYPQGSGSHRISLVSIEGKTMTEVVETSEVIFNLERYPAGMYLISVVNDSGGSFRQKVLR
jgi:hypothetical protein